MKTQQNLKTEKLNIFMRKELLLILFAIFLINSVSASEYFQEKVLLPDNITSRTFAFTDYVETNEDSIVNGQTYDTYILYNSNIATWNSLNPNATVYYCTLKVNYLTVSNYTNIIFEQNITSDIINRKFFVKLKLKDAYQVYADCIFATPQGRTLANLGMPLDFAIVTPTAECKACQYYLWSRDEIKLQKSIIVSSYSTKNIGYIKGFFAIFYDFAIMGFWVLMILLLLFSVGLIFFAIHWLIKYLEKTVK
jgi:hypothetical protein